MIDTKPKVQLRYPKIKIFLYGTFLCLYLKSSFKNTLFFLEHFINIRIIYNIISLRIKIRFHTIIKKSHTRCGPQYLPGFLGFGFHRKIVRMKYKQYMDK